MSCVCVRVVWVAVDGWGGLGTGADHTLTTTWTRVGLMLWGAIHPSIQCAGETCVQNTTTFAVSMCSIVALLVVLARMLRRRFKKQRGASMSLINLHVIITGRGGSGLIMVIRLTTLINTKQRRTRPSGGW